MQWIITVVGLAILSVLAWGVSRPAPPSYRDAPLESELLPHLSVMAGRLPGRRKTKITLSKGLLGELERAIGFLNQLPPEELLPSARWLCDNGRFLQEEAASLKLDLKAVEALPSTWEGESRLECFAREFLGHSSGDLRLQKLGEALKAWQSVTPFSGPELERLPLALRSVLLTILEEMAKLCASEQHAQLKAIQLTKALMKRQEKQAIRLLSLIHI